MLDSQYGSILQFNYRTSIQDLYQLLYLKGEMAPCQMAVWRTYSRTFSPKTSRKLNSIIKNLIRINL